MGFFSSGRADLGYAEMRIYSGEDIDFLSRIKNLIDSGMWVRAAFEYLDGGE